MLRMGPGCRGREVGVELCLYRIPKLRSDDTGMLAGVDQLAMADLADVERVAQQMGEPASVERLTADHPAAGHRPVLADDPVRRQRLGRVDQRAMNEIAREDEAYGCCLGLVGDELAVADIVAERDRSAHPHPLALRSRDLVANALAGDLTLELGEAEEDVKR